MSRLSTIDVLGLSVLARSSACLNLCLFCFHSEGASSEVKFSGSILAVR